MAEHTASTGVQAVSKSTFYDRIEEDLDEDKRSNDDKS